MDTKEISRLLRESYRASKKLKKEQERLRNLLSKNRQERQEKESVCTQKIAAYWMIPKLQGTKEEILSATIWNLIPAVPPKEQNDERRRIIIRLHNRLHDHDIQLVAECAEYERSRIFHRFRGNPTSKTEMLLQHCFDWNGLSFGMNDIDQSKIDPRLFQKISQLFDDVTPATAKKQLMERLDPEDNTQVIVLLRCTRKALVSHCKLDEKELSIVEAKLASIGRQLYAGRE